MSNQVDVLWLSQQIGRPSIYNIVSKIITLIDSGQITDGSLLPSIRALAKELKISPATVAVALNELKARNIVRSKPGYGTIVIDNPVTAFPLRLTDFSSHKSVTPYLDLSYAIPDYTLLPRPDRAIKQACKTCSVKKDKQSLIIPELKEVISIGWPYLTDSFLLFNNPFETITHLLKLFVAKDAYVAIENPSTINELDQIRRENIRLIAVDCDKQGPIISSLKKALAKKPVLFIYQPREHIATGNSVSEQRIAEIADLFKSHQVKTLIVEHDIIGDLSLLPSLSIGKYLPEQTIHIRAYNKIYNTDLSFIVLSGAEKIIQQLYNYRAYSIGWSSHLLQLTLAYLLQDKNSQLKIKKAKQIFNNRYRALLAALKKRRIYLADDEGLHLSLWLPVLSEQQVLGKLESKGIIALGGSHFMLRQLKHGQQHVRIMTSNLATQHLINQVADAIAYALLTPSEIPNIDR